MPGLKARCFWGGIRCFGGSAGAKKVGPRPEGNLRSERAGVFVLGRALEKGWGWRVGWGWRLGWGRGLIVEV